MHGETMGFVRRFATGRVGSAGIYLVASVLARAGAILLIPLYTRRFSTQQYGEYALAQTLIAFLSTPLCLCLHHAVVRFYFESTDRESARRRVGSAARWMLIITLGLTTLLQIGVLVTRPAGTHGIYGRWELTCIVWASAGLALSAVPATFLRISQRAMAAAALQLGDFFTGIGAGIVMVVVLGRGVRGGIEALALPACVTGTVGVVFILAALKGPLDLKTLRDGLAISLPFVPHTLGNQAQSISDRWIMKFTANEAALGVYALAGQLSVPVSMVIQAWHTASEPPLGEASRNGGLAGVAKRAAAYRWSYVIVTSAAALFLCLLLPAATHLIGKNFSGALRLVPVMCAILIVDSVYEANCTLVFYANRQATIPKITVTAGALNVALNAVLIRLFGLWGAVLARACSTSVRSLAMWYTARSALAPRAIEPTLARS